MQDWTLCATHCAAITYNNDPGRPYCQTFHEFRSCRDTADDCDLYHPRHRPITLDAYEIMRITREERHAKQAPSLRRKRCMSKFRIWFTSGEIMEPCRARSYGSACAIIRKNKGRNWRQDLDRIERINGEER